MIISHPYHLFLGDVTDPLSAKVAFGLTDWRPDWCIGQIRLAGCSVDVGLEEMTIPNAAQAGAETFVIGVANSGGILPDRWIPTIVEAIENGMHIASGMHVRLADIPEIAAAARRNGVMLHDLRRPAQSFSTGTGAKRSGLRLLAVGTDCSVGKKYASLCLERDMRAAGLDADFRATGQTGILIAQRGVAIDAVVSDFISGAAEWLTPDAAQDHWDVIEGQGSLFHPAFAGVSLGLLHGSQPDSFVVCHEPTRQTMRGVNTPVATIEAVIDQTIAHGRLTNPQIRCVGLCLNTQNLSTAQARDLINQTADHHGLPCTDPIRFGTKAIIEQLV